MARETCYFQILFANIFIILSLLFLSRQTTNLNGIPFVSSKLSNDKRHVTFILWICKRLCAHRASSPIAHTISTKHFSTNFHIKRNEKKTRNLNEKWKRESCKYTQHDACACDLHRFKHTHTHVYLIIKSFTQSIARLFLLFFFSSSSLFTLSCGDQNFVYFGCACAHSLWTKTIMRVWNLASNFLSVPFFILSLFFFLFILSNVDRRMTSMPKVL